jgi:hypothetical protein
MASRDPEQPNLLFILSDDQDSWAIAQNLEQSLGSVSRLLP